MPRFDNTKIDTPDETVTTTEYGVLYPSGMIKWAEANGGPSYHLLEYAGTNYIIVSHDAVTGQSVRHGANGFESLVSAFKDNVWGAGGAATTEPIVVKRMRIVTTTKATPL